MEGKFKESVSIHRKIQLKWPFYAFKRGFLEIKQHEKSKSENAFISYNIYTHPCI